MDLGEMEVRDGGRGEARNFSPPLPHPFCSFPSPFLSSPSSSSSSSDKPLDGMQRKREEGGEKIEAEFLHCLGSSLDRRRRPPFAHLSSIPENRPTPRGVHGEEKKSLGFNQERSQIILSRVHGRHKTNILRPRCRISTLANPTPPPDH